HYDSDWYVIDTLPTEDFGVAIRFFHSLGDLDLSLFQDINHDGYINRNHSDFGGERIDKSWNTGDCEYVTNVGNLGGTRYYLRVHGGEDYIYNAEYRLFRYDLDPDPESIDNMCFVDENVGLPICDE
ncbi:MAG: hypothetical protein QGI45_06885, partial [Myxococcota bacterium]|nr:hypothetical protein [Myxococcota bacterium]